MSKKKKINHSEASKRYVRTWKELKKAEALVKKLKVELHEHLLETMVAPVDESHFTPLGELRMDK